MVRFVHLFILSVLIIWLSGAGCVGNNTSEIGINSKAIDTGEDAGNTLEEPGLTEEEIQTFEADISELENMLENANLSEEIVIEEL